MINEKFIINLQGKKFVTYEGLLDLAHKKGLLSIQVDLLQIPNQDNDMTAICRAVATTEDSKFIDIGDANPRSVNSALVPHIIRMASTRAKARALRDLTNEGMNAVEELYMVEEDSAPISQEDAPTRRQMETIRCLEE